MVCYQSSIPASISASSVVSTDMVESSFKEIDDATIITFHSAERSEKNSIAFRVVFKDWDQRKNGELEKVTLKKIHWDFVPLEEG
jgi:hypothetical protein